LNGRVLDVDDMSLYDAGMVSGSIVEICISDPESIFGMYEYISGVQNPMKRNPSTFILDSYSLLSSRFLFSELSCGGSTISLKFLKRYCSYIGYSSSSFDRWSSLLGCCERVNENTFIVLYQLLVHDLEFDRIPPNLDQLLSIPLCSLHSVPSSVPSDLSDGDFCWVIPYNLLLNYLSLLNELGLYENLWHLPFENIRGLLYQLDENKDLWNGLYVVVVVL
jgi:hypothetical protein